MLPEKIKKAEKRLALIENLETLISKGYTNAELAGLLNIHRNVISGLRIKKTNYPMSLKKLDPLLEATKNILSSLDDSIQDTPEETDNPF